MIIVRSPLRISFVGGGSDLPDYYQISPGKVISAAIDKYVYVAINPAPLLKGYTARYSITENVDNIKDLKNDRIRETMIELGIKGSLEVGIFSHLPVGTGLGASSSCTVSLIKGFSTYIGKKLDRNKIAEMACKIEMNAISEPIGKQDQYAAAFGGFNVFQFNTDGSVNTESVYLDYKKRVDLENHILIFFTGITRQASSVLADQRNNIASKIDTLRSMVNQVDIFKKKLSKGDFKSMGCLLHENWIKKKSLSTKISNHIIDQLYESGIKAGAWGGKILGAGGGGCLMFLVPDHKKVAVRNSIKATAKKQNLPNLKEFPVKFVQSGVELVSNSSYS